MTKIKQKYLMITIDLQPDGFSVQAWINIDRPHPIDLLSYPNTYTYMGEHCTWFMFASSEMTPKMVVMAGEQADRICVAGEKQANNRKAVNR